MRPYLFALTLLAATAAPVAAKPADPAIRAAIDAAVSAPTRTPANRARDPYRHPAETLASFGIKPGDRIVELWPFGGWFTEILTPFVNSGGGTLTVASPPGNTTQRSPPNWRSKNLDFARTSPSSTLGKAEWSIAQSN